MDYYNLFIEISLQQCKKDDYGDKQKVRAHNLAIKKIEQLKSKISQQNSEEILCRLLKHTDERVKINAASTCLQENILVDQAVSTLKEIVDNTTDPTFCFSAEILLKKHER